MSAGPHADEVGGVVACLALRPQDIAIQQVVETLGILVRRHPGNLTELAGARKVGA